MYRNKYLNHENRNQSKCLNSCLTLKYAILRVKYIQYTRIIMNRIIYQIATIPFHHQHDVCSKIYYDIINSRWVGKTAFVQYSCNLTLLEMKICML